MKLLGSSAYHQSNDAYIVLDTGASDKAEQIKRVPYTDASDALKLSIDALKDELAAKSEEARQTAIDVKERHAARCDDIGMKQLTDDTIKQQLDSSFRRGHGNINELLLLQISVESDVKTVREKMISMDRRVLTRASLDKAFLSFAQLREADVRQASFREAHLLGANLERAEAQGSTFRNAHLEAANIGGACFAGANLKGARLDHVRGGSFFGASIGWQGPDFRGAFLGNTICRMADLANARFDGACLGGAELDQADLRNSHFEGADCRLASFKGAKLDGAVFFKANCKGARFQGASFNNAYISGMSNLLEATFDELSPVTLVRRSQKVTDDFYECCSRRSGGDEDDGYYVDDACEPEDGEKEARDLEIDNLLVDSRPLLLCCGDEPTQNVAGGKSLEEFYSGIGSRIRSENSRADPMGTIRDFMGTKFTKAYKTITRLRKSYDQSAQACLDAMHDVLITLELDLKTKLKVYASKAHRTSNERLISAIEACSEKRTEKVESPVLVALDNAFVMLQMVENASESTLLEAELALRASQTPEVPDRFVKRIIETNTSYKADGIISLLRALRIPSVQLMRDEKELSAILQTFEKLQQPISSSNWDQVTEDWLVFHAGAGDLICEKTRIIVHEIFMEKDLLVGLGAARQMLNVADAHEPPQGLLLLLKKGQGTFKCRLRHYVRSVQKEQALIIRIRQVKSRAWCALGLFLLFMLQLASSVILKFVFDSSWHVEFS